MLKNKKCRVYFGFVDVGIFDKKYERSIWDNNGIFQFEGSAHFGQGTRISNSGKIVFGDNFCVTANSAIVCVSNINFGSNVLLSWDILILDTDFHKIYSIDDEHQINNPKKIIIGSNVWIGCRSLILKGVELKNNTIVAAASVISHSNTEENSIINSNRIIKNNVIWKE
ncbi:hypothetical protein [[Clostridium] innocuum]|uniref:hypothetical protein n=1 Tax=Clostridium innocuum TaxID=1522 RepID=UPI0032599EBB